MSDWTRDLDGNYIDWTKPPYKVGGVINLLLPGETSISDQEIGKRNQEYMKLTKRSMGRTNDSAPTAETDRGDLRNQSTLW